ncbi:hypothetical protein QJS66_16930 [Kocuria rhizophila]|nr:hypothetical protein QJS66_16930 [Kocuria rhizophila]
MDERSFALDLEVSAMIVDREFRAAWSAWSRTSRRATLLDAAVLEQCSRRKVRGEHLPPHLRPADTTPDDDAARPGGTAVSAPPTAPPTEPGRPGCGRGPGRAGVCPRASRPG